jgi:hypothetical protein
MKRRPRKDLSSFLETAEDAASAILVGAEVGVIIFVVAVAVWALPRL